MALILAVFYAQPVAADDTFVFGRSATHKLQVVAEGAPNWCGPHLKLSMVLDAGSPDIGNPAGLVAVMNGLKHPIATDCAAATEADLTVVIGGKPQGIYYATAAGGWVFATAPAASPPQKSAPAVNEASLPGPGPATATSQSPVPVTNDSGPAGPPALAAPSPARSPAVVAPGAPATVPATTNSTITSMANKCTCPVIPPVATSDKPAPGKVWHELAEDDLKAIFSNRIDLYGGSWEKALADLAHDIDLNGALGISKGPPPTPIATTAVEESRFTESLIKGRRNVSRPQWKGGNSWALLTGTDFLMDAIIRTLARINKYGEPEFGLRRDLLRLARFLLSDLNGDWGPNLDPRANEIRSDVRLARQALTGALLAVTQNVLEPAAKRGQDLRADSPHPGASPDLLPLTRLDLANAALDAQYSVDDKGKTSVTPPEPDYNYVSEQVKIGNLSSAQLSPDERVTEQSLYELAGWRGIYGGAASPGSPEDAVGCKAFMTLVALMGKDVKNSDAVRRWLWRVPAAMVGSASQAPGSVTNPYAAVYFPAVRSALILAGAQTTKDVSSAETTAADLLELAQVFTRRARVKEPQSSPQYEPAALAVFDTLRAFEASMGGSAGAAASAAIAQRTHDAIAAAQKALAAGTTYPEPPQAMVDFWNSSQSTWKKEVAGQLCAPVGAPLNFLILVKAGAGPILVKKFYMNVPLMLGVRFDEPYDGAEYPISLEVGGNTLDLVAKPIDKRRMLFETQVFMLGSGGFNE